MGVPNIQQLSDIGHLITHLAPSDNELYQALLRLRQALIAVNNAIVDVDFDLTAGKVKVTHPIRQEFANTYSRSVTDILGDATSIFNWFPDDGTAKEVADRTGAVNVTQYIQNAIDEVNARGGGEIYFPPGLYVIGDSGDLTAPGLVIKSGVCLRGHSIVGTMFRYVGQGDAMVLNATQGCILSNFYLFCANPHDDLVGIHIRNSDGDSLRNRFANIKVWGTPTFVDGPSGDLVSTNADGLNTCVQNAYDLGLRDGMFSTRQGTSNPSNNGLEGIVVLERDLVTGDPTGNFFSAGSASTGGTWTSRYYEFKGKGIFFDDTAVEPMYFNVVDQCFVAFFASGIHFEGNDTFNTPNGNFLYGNETSGCLEHLVFRRFVGNCGVNGHFCNGSGVNYPIQTGLVMGNGVEILGAYNHHINNVHCDIGRFSRAYYLETNCRFNYITIDDQCGLPSVNLGPNNTIVLTQGARLQSVFPKINMDVNYTAPTGSAFSTVELYLRKSPDQSSNLITVDDVLEFVDGTPKNFFRVSQYGELILSGLFNAASIWTSVQGLGWLGSALPQNFDDVMLGYNMKFVAGQFDPADPDYGDDVFRQRQPNWAGGYAGIRAGFGGLVQFYADPNTTTEASGTIVDIVDGLVTTSAPHGVPIGATVSITGSSNPAFNIPGLTFRVQEDNYTATTFQLLVDASGTGGTWHWGLDKPIDPQPVPKVIIDPDGIRIEHYPGVATQPAFTVTNKDTATLMLSLSTLGLKLFNQVELKTYNGNPNGAVVGSVGDVCFVTDGSIWSKTSGTGTDTGWTQIVNTTSGSGSFVALTGNQTVAGVKTFSNGITLGGSSVLTAKSGAAGVDATSSFGGITLTVSGGVVTGLSGTFTAPALAGTNVWTGANTFNSNPLTIGSQLVLGGGATVQAPSGGAGSTSTPSIGGLNFIFSAGIFTGVSGSVGGNYTGTVNIGGVTLTVVNGMISNITGSFGSGVSSFNGRTGAVVPVSGDYTTSQISGSIGNLSGTLVSSQFPVVVTADNLVLAKITGGGTDGALQWDAQGRIIAYTKPT